MDYFPTADSNRNNARNNIIIFDEVVAIQRNILTTTSNGGYSCIVNGTTMTSKNTGSAYYDVVKTGETTLSDSDAISDQITSVTNYFINLGYTVSKIDDGDGTFSWKLQW